MELTKRTEIGIKILCIIILLALNIAIYLNGKDLSCDNCTIKFSFKQNNQEMSFDKNVTDLFNSYKMNECLVKYDSGGTNAIN